METGKSEITKMPAGMSSEELDKATTDKEISDDTPLSSGEADTKLAQEALAATGDESSPAEESVETDEVEKPEEEETPVEEEKPKDEEKPKAVDPKDAVIGDFRRKLRDSELEAATLKGKLEAQESIRTKTEPPPKSPIEIAEAAYIEENDNLEGFAMSGKLYREQKAFDDEQATKTTATAEYAEKTTVMDKAAKSLQADELSVEKAGEGLDFNTVVSLGQGYLDKADLLKIEIVSKRDGIDASVRKAYELCKQVILAANNEDSKLLQNAINIKAGKKSKAQTKPKTKEGKTDIDALTTEGEDADAGEAETGTQHKRLLSFLGEDGFMEG